MRVTNEEIFDLVAGELGEGGYLVALLVIREGLSREQAVMALEVERLNHLRQRGRGFDVTECDGECFELLDPQGQSYRRYFLERAA